MHTQCVEFDNIRSKYYKLCKWVTKCVKKFTTCFTKNKDVWPYPPKGAQKLISVNKEFLHQELCNQQKNCP